MYYVTFLMVFLPQSRCAIIAIQACLEAVLAFLNHFPLFAIMLRAKDPERLPGGLKIICTAEGNLELKARSLSVCRVIC